MTSWAESPRRRRFIRRSRLPGCFTKRCWDCIISARSRKNPGNWPSSTRQCWRPVCRQARCADKHKEKAMEFAEDLMCTCGHPGGDHVKEEPHACRKWECACEVFAC